MTKLQHRLSLLIGLVLVLTLMPAPEPVYAQWPPFGFNMTPSYENGRITYSLRFSSQVDWMMSNVAIKIPLPEGTRFLEANALPMTSVDFDGAEVTFFTHVLYRSIQDTSFVVEVVDPTMTVFTTYVWITWEGDQPGDYLVKDVSIDTTLQPLNWERPAGSSLQLEASATVADDVITYAIYPQNVGWLRMWDLRINVSIPEGTTFLSADAPPPFVASFDGREVSFSGVELERQAEVGPFSFKVSTEGVVAPFVVTHVWAGWRNVGRSVGQRIAVQEETRTGDIAVQPHASQWVVADVIGDVPFPNYDLTSIAFQEEGAALKIVFYIVGDLGPVNELLEYNLYIDGDCRTDTGEWRHYRGAEYQVRYRHWKSQADIRFWDEEKGNWRGSQPIEVDSPEGERMITLWVPYDLLQGGRRFCWVGQAKDRTGTFYPNPPAEWVPDGKDLSLTQYEVVTTAITTETITSTTDLPTNNVFNRE
jgi:hypothetical protein